MSKDLNNLQSFAQALHKQLASRLPGRGVKLSDVQESLASAAGAGPWNVAVAQQARLLQDVRCSPCRALRIELKFQGGALEQIEGSIQSAKVQLLAQGADPEVATTKGSSSKVVRATFHVEGVEKSVQVSGATWRNLEASRCVEAFVRLVAVGQKELSLEAAALLDSQEPVRRLYRALATRDGATESCIFYSASQDEDELLEEAESRDDWEVNDGNPTERPYFGSCVDDDVEEVSLKEFFRDMCQKALDLRSRRRREQAFTLVQDLAGMNLASVPALQEILQRAADLVRD